MPLRKPKYPKITTELARCLDSHVGPDDVVYREGDLVALDDPDVLKLPGFYAAAGLPTAQYHALRQQRFTAHLVDLEGSHK
jgi:hypothetical protein